MKGNFQAIKQTEIQLLQLDKAELEASGYSAMQQWAEQGRELVVFALPPGVKAEREHLAALFAAVKSRPGPTQTKTEEFSSYMKSTF